MIINYKNNCGHFGGLICPLPCCFFLAKKYVVDVITGDVKGAGTDANVFLNIFGKKGDCGERQLKKSETHQNKFEKGQVCSNIINIKSISLI